MNYVLFILDDDKVDISGNQIYKDLHFVLVSSLSKQEVESLESIVLFLQFDNPINKMIEILTRRNICFLPHPSALLKHHGDTEIVLRLVGRLSAHTMKSGKVELPSGWNHMQMAGSVKAALFFPEIVDVLVRMRGGWLVAVSDPVLDTNPLYKTSSDQSYPCSCRRQSLIKGLATLRFSKQTPLVRTSVVSSTNELIFGTNLCVLFGDFKDMGGREYLISSQSLKAKPNGTLYRWEHNK